MAGNGAQNAALHSHSLNSAYNRQGIEDDKKTAGQEQLLDVRESGKHHQLILGLLYCLRIVKKNKLGLS